MSRFTLLSLFRWLEVLLLGLLLFPLLELLFASGWAQKFGEVIRASTLWVRFGVWTLLSTVFFTLAFRVGALGPYHLKRWRYLTYPPIWFSPVIGIALVVLTHWIRGNDDMPLKETFSQLGVGILAAALGLGLAFLFDVLRRAWETKPSKKSLSETRTDSSSSKTEPVTDNDLLDWIMTEEPIVHPSQDMFGHKHIAKRIARRILSSDSATIGLTGPYGSGKSSVVNLVKYYLATPGSLDAAPSSGRQIICCDVRGWGRAHENIAQQVLNIVLHEVKKYVDVSSLIGVPASYRQALGEADSFVGSVATALSHGTPEPLVQLQRLDNILAVANLRVVLFLEDLDRDLSDEMLKVEVPGLLDRLRNLHYVSFLIAAASERFALESIHRICDYTESLT